MTALRQLHDAETSGPFSILIGTILSARTRDENTAKVVKKLFAVYKNAKDLSGARVRDVERIIKSIGGSTTDSIVLFSDARRSLRTSACNIQNDYTLAADLPHSPRSGTALPGFIHERMARCAKCTAPLLRANIQAVCKYLQHCTFTAQGYLWSF